MDSDTKVALLSNSPSDDAAGLVHPAGAGVQDPRRGQQEGRHTPHDGAFHVHPGMARLARQGRRGDREVQAGFVEGLHGRRQHPQGARRASLARRRREADVSVLREDREVRHQERLHPQGPVRAGGRREIPAPAALCRCQRHRQGGEGLAAAQFPRLPLGLSLGRRQPGRRHGRVRPDRPQSHGPATSPRSPRNTASPTSMAISARSSPGPRWRSRVSPRR